MNDCSFLFFHIDSVSSNIWYIFNKSNVDNVSIATNQDYVKALMHLFSMRS